MKTARGIYHDLSQTEYTFTVGEITFHFSSQLYRDKFVALYEDEKERFNKSLNNVYKNKFTIAGEPLALIRLYCLIEKRGFHIILNGVVCQCPGDLVFAVTPNYNKKSGE